MTPEVAAKLASSDILMVTEAREYCLFTRGECMALVQVAGGRFQGIGSTGMMTEGGLSYLVWRDSKAWLASHGSRVEALPEQVAAIRKFSEDLKVSLGLENDK